ncbi:hypothetical protein B7463_g9795, partial [Scytalidium lignicola]
MVIKRSYEESTLEEKSLRCIIIGAGVSGILMAHHLREAFGDRVGIRILEKNAEIGGTCYASSSEIQSYLKAVVLHYRLDPYIHFNSKVEEAVWREDSSTWSVSVEGRGKFDCDILVNAGGILNNPKFPNLKNIDSFKGQLVHTAAWDNNIDVKNKRVAIIGAGASAIQVLPEIQSAAANVDIYIRTPSWISPPAGAQFNGEHNHIYTEEEKAQFRDDPNHSLRTRKDMESSFNCMYRAFFKGSDEQKQFVKKLDTHMRELIHSEGLQKGLIPSFEVGCRRINPGERYLEALQRDNVEPVFSDIQEVTPTGIRDADGTERPVDIIIAATGFDTSFRPRFPIIGRNGVDLRELWKTNPVSYCGLAVSGFPNYLIFLGPNTPIANGSLIGALEATGDYFIRLLRKMMTQQVSSFNIRADVEADFDMHTQDFMQRMVWTGSCRSWFKNDDGKVTAVWPGSGLHYREFLQSDRWEDWEWKYTANRFQYWGLGFSTVETVSEGQERDLSYYIQSHPNLSREVLEMVDCKRDKIINGDDSDESAGELVSKEFKASEYEEEESCKTSETSWDDEDLLKKDPVTGKDSRTKVSLPEVAAFSA